MKILVIKLRYIGDTILITPLLNALKEGMRGAQVDVLVNKETIDVLVDNPYVQHAWAFDHQASKRSPWYTFNLIRLLRREHYNMVIDLTNNDRSAVLSFASGAPLRIGYASEQVVRQRLFYNRIIDSVLGRVHTVDHHLKVAEELGIPVIHRNPFIFVSSAKLKGMEERLSRLGLENEEPFAIIHPGARRWYKSWPLEQFAGLADRIIKVCRIRVVLTGGKEDIEVSLKIGEHMQEEVLNLTGQVPLSDFPALAKRAVCLIGNDSAPIHIATAVGTPAIALFGPTDWKAWRPRRAHDRVIAAAFPCMPCGHAKPDCPLGESYCMSTIRFEEVWNAVEETISGIVKEST